MVVFQDSVMLFSCVACTHCTLCDYEMFLSTDTMRNIFYFNICLSLILVLGACLHLVYDISCSFCLENAGAGDPWEPTGQIPLKVSQDFLI